MISEHLHIADLIKRYITCDINRGELQQLNQWLDIDPSNREIFENIIAKNGFDQIDIESNVAQSYKNFEGVVSRTDMPRINARMQIRRYAMWASAAMVVMVVAIGLALFMNQNQGAIHRTAMVLKHTPSSAILVLDSGEKMQLSDSTVRLNSGAAVEMRDDNAVLSYRGAEVKATQADAVSVNTLIVPRGSDYRLELCDGTVVYLNADSELEYPVNFTGNTRRVKLRGMAYFKVAHNAQKPFIVATSHSTIRVLGTEFCVSDFNNGLSTVTLVNGRVNVTDPHGKDFALIPGQQARITAQNSQVCQVETMYYTAWKDGFFIFNGATIREIMEELSAWYDVDYVLSSPEIMDIRISARLKKYDQINPILDVLSSMDDIGFIRDKRTITVIKK